MRGLMKHAILLLLFAQPLSAIDFRDPSSLVERAIDLHPTLAALRADVSAAQERVAPAGALPNPMLMAGVQNKQLDLRDDEMMTMYMIGASQTFIRREKRESRTAAARLAALAAEYEYASARAAVERDVLLAWYDLASADAQLRTTESVREIIDAVVAASRVRYEIGTSIQADVIRAQLQQSTLERELIRLRGMRRNALARLLPLLELPFDTEVDRIDLPEHATRGAIEGTPVPSADHPVLAALEAVVEQAEEDIRLAEAARIPDIDLEAQYGYRPMQRDMFSLTARIELPLRKDVTIEPRVREAILRREAVRARIAEARRQISAAMGSAIAAHDEATQQLRLYEEVLVPQAQLAFESTLAAYQTGAASFESILATETDYLRLRLQYHELAQRHAQAIVSYEALVRGARPGPMPNLTPVASAATPAAASNPMGSM